VKSKLTRPVSRTVTFSRGALDGPPEEMALTLHALPLGYTQFLERVFPQPTVFLNGEPVPDPARKSEWSYEVNLLCIAKALGDELDTAAPVASTRDAWQVYATAVRAEFAAAGLVDGDIGVMLNELAKCQRGVATTGKA
jgi:hypothetical protein